jgi:hypothetical protein
MSADVILGEKFEKGNEKKGQKECVRYKYVYVKGRGRKFPFSPIY